VTTWRSVRSFFLYQILVRMITIFSFLIKKKGDAFFDASPFSLETTLASASLIKFRSIQYFKKLVYEAS